MAEENIENLLDIAALIARHRTGSLSPIERTALDLWLATDPANRALFDELNNQSWLDEALTAHDPEALRASATRLYQALGMQAPTIPIRRRTPIRLITRWTAAAAVIVALATGAWLAYFRHQVPAATTTPTTPTIATNDIRAPQGARTTLTLANGQTIILDSSILGPLAQQGSTRISKPAAHELSYQPTNTPGTEIIYNTLTTARGGQTTVTLADGTKVWLNAESSLHFPTAFNGAIREVELTGEAYFEVVHNAAQPFRVHAGKTLIEDIGTSFDINAYNDEPDLKTTLLQGAIRVNGRRLSPGEQALISEGGQPRIKNDIDPAEILAWKNGEFVFRRTDMSAILRQISRWYDVDISAPPQSAHRTFSGIVSRQSNLSDVMKIFEGADIKFKIDGKKLTLIQ